MARAAGLRHITREAFDVTLISTAQLDDVAIGITNKYGYLSAVAEADRTLRDCNIVRVQGGDGRGDRYDAKRHMRITRVSVRRVHQHVCPRITRIGIEDQIEFHPSCVLDDRDVVAVGATQRIEP